MALLTLVVGIAGVVIAWLVYRLQCIQVRLDLYGRRFKVYKALTDFLRDVVSDAQVPVERLYKYRAGVAESAFLFDKNINDYLDTVFRRAVELRCLSHKMASTSHPVVDDSALLKWFDDRLSESHELFMKDLGLQGNGILSHVLSRTFSLYSSFKAHLIRR